MDIFKEKCMLHLNLQGSAIQSARPQPLIFKVHGLPSGSCFLKEGVIHSITLREVHPSF